MTRWTDSWAEICVESRVDVICWEEKWEERRVDLIGCLHVRSTQRRSKEIGKSIRELLSEHNIDPPVMGADVLDGSRRNQASSLSTVQAIFGRVFLGTDGHRTAQKELQHMKEGKMAQPDSTACHENKFTQTDAVQTIFLNSEFYKATTATSQEINS
ncbi:uncharacterized protein LOC144886843 [Branchiostoma floridae x Branchiostoma japonicum]